MAGDPAVDARLAGELAGRQARAPEEFGVEWLLNEVEMPRSRCSPRWSASDSASTPRSSQRSAPAWRTRSPSSSARSTARRARVHDRLAAAARDGVLRRARADQEAPRQDRPPPTRRSSASCATSIRSSRRWSAGELTKLKNTYLDSLPKLVDEHGRIHTTFNQVATTTRTALEHESEPAEHPDPLGGRSAGPRLLRRRPGPATAVLRLQPGRARVLAHVAGEDVLREIFASGEDVHAATAAGIVGAADPDKITPAERSKAKMVNYGIAYGLGLRPRRPPQHRSRGGRHLHRAVLRALPGRQALHRRHDRYGRAAGLCDHADGRTTQCSRAPLRSAPAPPARRAPRGQHGDQGHRRRHHQGGDGGSAQGARRRRPATELVLQIHDELLFEGPTGEMDAAAEIAKREMVGAFDLDPPLAVDVGVGGDWLAAK